MGAILHERLVAMKTRYPKEIGWVDGRSGGWHRLRKPAPQ
jgi:hypothetical protein